MRRSEKANMRRAKLYAITFFPFAFAICFILLYVLTGIKDFFFDNLREIRIPFVLIGSIIAALAGCIAMYRDAKGKIEDSVRE